MAGASEERVAIKRIKEVKPASVRQWLGGIMFTFVIAWAGLELSRLPGLLHLGQLGCAILIAVLFRQVWGYPEMFRSGIQFSSKKVLQGAIVLYGLKLNIHDVFNQGLGLLVRDAGTIVLAIAATMLLAKWLKADLPLSLLLGIGTGVCGAAAIAAVSPIVKAKDEDTALAVGIVALIGTVFAVVYTVLRPYLPLSPVEYGVWSGISLHEIAHVALAAAPAGQDALTFALLAKLGRVCLLVPLCFILMYGMKRKGNSSAGAPIAFPWFLLGFLAMSLFGSYVLTPYIPAAPSAMNGISGVTAFMLTMAMTGLGLNVNLRGLGARVLRPAAAMTIASVLLSVLAYWLS